MSVFALHLPESRKPARWLLAGAAIVAVHAAIIAGAVLWTERTPHQLTIIPAIAVTLAPTQSAAPQVQAQEDLPVGPEMQQADAAPPAPPKVEEQKPDEPMPPPPPAENADAALPKPEPKQLEEPKPVSQPPAPETTAPPKNDRIGEFSQAGANAYNALVAGHLERFRHYPAAARGVTGRVTVHFVLNRTGEVIDREVVTSSGNKVLDNEALEILRRASPFPAFPKAKPGDQDDYTMPISFSR